MVSKTFLSIPKKSNQNNYLMTTFTCNLNDATPTLDGSLCHPVTSSEVEFYQLAPANL
jgi:hypothetical protein